MIQPNIGTSPQRGGAGLIVGLFGVVTCLFTALLLWWVEKSFGIALYSWMFWFIVPAGALISGMLGASGYYVGATLLGHRPTSLLLIIILLSSVATFFAVQFLSYFTLEIRGKAVRDFIPFTEYLDITIRSMSMQFRNQGSTGELGVWGYGVTILQILGFATGGFFVYGYLTSLPYCERCARYFATKGSLVRYTGDEPGLQATAAQILNDFQSGAVALAVANHVAFGDPKPQKKANLRSTIEVRRCKQCGQHWLKYGVEKKRGNDWKEVPQVKAVAFTDQAVDV